MILSIHHFRAHGPNRWTHTGADWGAKAQSWQTCAEATVEAIKYGLALGGLTGITGHADREVLRRAGLPYVDSRGNRRRGGGSTARQRAKFDALMASRRGGGL